MRYAKAMAGLVALGLGGLACSQERAPEGMMVLALAPIGLEIQAPEGTKASKNAVGIGVMLKGPDVSMTIGPTLEVDAVDLEQAKANAQAYAPADLQSETLSDGYVLTYESEGSTGTNYWLVGRRELDGVAYSCGVSSPKEAHQRTAIAICKSLKKR